MRLQFPRLPSWSVGLLPSARQGLFLPLQQLSCHSFCLPWPNKSSAFAPCWLINFQMGQGVGIVSWMVLATITADAKKSGRAGGCWLPLPLAGFYCIALLFHGASASGEGTWCVLRNSSSHLWPKFNNLFLYSWTRTLHHSPEDFVTFSNKFSWINWYDRKKEDRNHRSGSLFSVFRKIMEQLLMKNLTGTWGTWTPKVSSSLIFFLICHCFASFTNVKQLWPVLLSDLFIRKRRNTSKHIWLYCLLWITSFSLSKLFLRQISLWGSRWANMLVKFVGIRTYINSELGTLQFIELLAGSIFLSTTCQRMSHLHKNGAINEPNFYFLH